MYARVNFHFIYQEEPLGLGHAVYLAKELVKDEPFLLSLCDEFLVPGPSSCFEEMLLMYQRFSGSIVALKEVPRSDVVHYGIVSEGVNGKITGLVEKPSIDTTPSNKALIGKYLLSSSVFKYLERDLSRHTSGEVQLTDALHSLIEEETVQGYYHEGDRFDCGQPKGYLAANVFMAKHPETLES